MTRLQKAVDRFWSRVNKTASCWLWTGPCRGGHGYGGCWNGYETDYAHRFAYRITKGEIPSGMAVMHECDVRLCVNPSHLKLGTNAQNSRDMVEKSRQSRGARHPLSKITPDMVREIRSRAERRECSQRSMAAEYGLCPNQINRIVRRLDWKHVD